jgi:hypothetical protein
LNPPKVNVQVGLKREKIQSVSSNYFFLIKPTSQRESKKSSVFKKWIEKKEKHLKRMLKWMEWLV